MIPLPVWDFILNYYQNKDQNLYQTNTNTDNGFYIYFKPISIYQFKPIYRYWE